jgi:hypothetical protein
MRISSWVAIGIPGFVSCSSVFAYMIDGNLADWGVQVADNNASSYNLAGPGLLGFHLEDQNDLAGEGSYLGPNYGGQNYDAELLAVAHESNWLYIAMVTGQRPDNGFASFAPGDIRILTDAGSYGIEVGGGPGGGPGTSITAGAPGSTYTLNSVGYTVGHSFADAAQTAGSLWTDVNWLNDPIAPQGPTQFMITPDSKLAGTSEYIYTRNSQTGQHAVVELAVNLSAFGGQTLQSVHWRPSCGNDELDVSLPHMPEPATATLLLLGLGGLFHKRRS